MATPKQIRELMKVEGLTNDEVKSHLQVSEMSVFDQIRVQTTHDYYFSAYLICISFVVNTTYVVDLSFYYAEVQASC